MRSMTFQIDDRSTDRIVPAVLVTITEREDGTLAFTITVLGDYTGDLRGFFFDLADESLVGTLSVEPASDGLTEFRQADDGVLNLGAGSNLQGLAGSDGGYDAGIEIGTAGTGGDDYQSFSFTLSSTERALTLEDFSGVDFGVRLTSVGEIGGSRDAGAKLLETTSSAIDARDDANEVHEDSAANPVTGNVFANDLNLAGAVSVIAVNGSAGAVGADIEGTYGTLRLNADGTYTYTLDNARTSVQALSEGEVVTESFAYTATSSDEATSSSTDSAALTITIVGTNDAPEISGAVEGLVYEDGARVARGQLETGDPDDAAADWSIETGPAYGFASVDASGGWTYTLDNTRFEVQSLAQDEVFLDTFVVRASDPQDAFDTQEVTVAISGTNDRPFITTPPGFGALVEDGEVQSVTGQALAFDVDSDAGAATWSLSRDTPFGYAADYHVTMDAFRIWRNGTWIFDDEFDDGVAPPSAPPFVNSQPANYVVGGIVAEDAFTGRLIIDGSQAISFPGIGYPEMDAGHAATLGTNTDSANATNGLKIGHDFVVEAVFDLTIPDQEREGYGFQLSDALGGPLETNLLGDDRAAIAVRRTDGEAYIQLTHADAVTDARSIVARHLLEPLAGDQILLRLAHDNDNPGVITASYDYLSGGLVTGGGELGTAMLFGRDTPGYAGDDENWVRAQILAFGPETFEDVASLEGDYGTLDIDADGQWTYVLDNDSAAVQALGTLDTVFDTFHVRATDQYGLSSSQPLVIQVNGVNDAPDAAPACFLALEDTLLLGVLSAFDAEGDSFTFELLAAPEHGTVSVASDGSFTYAPAEDFSGPDTFSYAARDVHGAAGTASVSLDVIAVADAPTLTITESTGGDSGEFAITQDDPSNQSGIAPRIAALDDGGFVVTWSSFGAGHSDVFATIFDAAGSSSQAFQVSADDPTDQQYVNQQAVTQLADGNLAFVWRKLDGFSLAEEVVARLFDPEGAPITGEIFVESVFSSIPETLEPQVAPFGDGFVTIWAAQALFDFSSDVFGQVLDASGQEIGGPFQISAPGLPGGLHVARDGSVAGLADGGFVVLYTEVGDFSQGVYGQRYDANAAPVGPLFAVTSDFSADAPDVAGLPDGGFVASWNSFDPASGSFDIRAQRFGPDGGPLGGAIPVSVDEPGAFGQDDFGSSIAATSDGGFAVAWSGFRLSEDGMGDSDVFFRRFDADGFPLDDEIRLNQNDLSFNFGPDVAGLSSGQAATTWYADSGFLGATKGRVLGGDAGLVTSPGMPIALNIAAALADTDGSEFLTLTISGVPAGGMLSAGTDNDDGSWSLAPGDLEGLTFTPPPDSGEDVTLTVTATATELSNGDQASTSQSVTIVVNSAPDITGGDSSGLVYEDGARVARGQLAAVDPDGTTPAWSIGATPMLGFASVDADGTWTYTLDNSRFEVQSLAQDETRFDTFTVRARDDQGGSDSQEVTIAITGTNDRPVVLQDFPPPPPPEVRVDDVLVATGQAFAFDVDSDAGPAAWSISRGTPAGYASDYVVTMDSFRVWKNGTWIFEDGFDDGAPPASAPDFSNGQPASYSNVGGVFVEDVFTGRLIMDGALATVFTGTGYPEMDAGHAAALSTNTDPSNLVSGLKSNHDFVVEAVFDLTVPDQDREGYGFQLSDGFNQLGDDRAVIAVRRTGDEVHVRFGNNDAVGDTRLLVGQHLLDAEAGDQILLRLSHDNDNPGVITASYEYLSGGVGTGSGGELGSTSIFGLDTPGYAGDDENWTRAQLLAFGPESFEHVTSLEGEYGTLSIDADGQWAYALDNDAPEVRALGAQDTVFDTFHVRATDQYGLSASQPLTVAIHGAGEAIPSGHVYEDGPQVARGQAGGAGDWALESPAAHGFASVDATGGWTYVLDNFHFDVQSLALGQTLVDTFTVSATDENGAWTSEQVTVPVIGSNDRPFVSQEFPPPPPPEVSEDDVLVASGQAFAFDIDSDAGPAAWSLSRGTAFGYGSDYHATMDAFRILRDGTWIFDDEFDDGAPPPSAPAFASGQSASYSNVGGIFVEDPFTGRLIMDGSQASSFPGIGYPDMDAGHSATLGTNTDSTNTANGLKISHDFMVEAVFDLTVPDQDREGYGFQLSDALSDMSLLGDDRAAIAVRRVDGEVYVQITSTDAVTDSRTVIARHLLDPLAGEQILLRLEHDDDSPGVITASYHYLSGGVVTGGDVLGTAMIFGRDTPGYAGDDENWTRAQILAFGPESFEDVTSLQGDYGTLSIEADGQWSYALDNDAAEVQALGTGQTVFDAFHLRATDQYGLSSSQPLTIAIHGADDEIPDGLVYEDGPRVARGQAGGAGDWALESPAAFGFASVDEVGAWTYVLDNFHFEVQSLAQGQGLFDTFSVSAIDANGVLSTEQVTVKVTGTNDRPFVEPPIAPSVAEDLAPVATGQAFAFDPDSDAGPATWSLSRGTGLGYDAEYYVEMDAFRIWRNGTWIFEDEFEDGTAPPSAPPFVNGQAASYGTSGVFLEDGAGGRLVMDGVLASAFPGNGYPEMDAGHAAVLNTNTDPSSLTAGLKSNHDFVVEAVFDLVVPDQEREGYGFQLSDAFNQLGDDRAAIAVRRTDGEVYIQLASNDAVADTRSVVARHLLDPLAGDQILLRLSHAASEPGVITASYEYLSGGLGTGGVELGTAIVFGLDTPGYAGDDENWTRAQILAFGPETFEHVTSLQGDYGSLSIDPNGAWTYTLDNDAPHVQALGAGQVVFDAFHLRATDQYGLSGSQQLFIPVEGSSDGGVTVFGTPEADTLAGSAFDDVLVGGGGSDVLSGLEGPDRFDFDALDEGVDTITDFEAVPGGDMLDIRDLLEPSGAPLDARVRLEESGGATTVWVNPDSFGEDFAALARLEEVTGLTLDDFWANGNLIV
jgi:VCBS repeat-containing protein